jgi:branched-chain amino acid aminotransferase
MQRAPCVVGPFYRSLPAIFIPTERPASDGPKPDAPEACRVEYHVNGELVAREAATVSVEDRGFRYGDGVFETMRAYGGEVLDWNRHVARLRRGCERLGMAGAVPEDLAVRVAETLDANGLADAYVRVNLTRGVQPGKLTPREDVDPTVVVVVTQLPPGGCDGEKVWDGPATVQTVSTRRPPDASIPADVKTHNYLPGIVARLELRRAAGPDHSPDEALVRDVDGALASGSTSNVFFVADGTLKTPAEGPILPGITREVVLELAEDEAFPVETGRYEVNDVREADEAFLTNRTWELRPVGTVDGLEVGGGPITALLGRLYDERVERRCYGG